MTPHETLKNLKKMSSTRVQATLDAIFETCQEQLDSGYNDFSYSTISRLGVKRGVPKSQSIRNVTGKHYRALIDSFSNSNTSKKKFKITNRKDAWIDEIEDHKIKLLVQIQASELLESKKLLKELIPPNMEIHVFDKQIHQSITPFNNPERRALNYLVSNDFLDKWNFKLGEHGDILDSNNNTVFKVATIDAINKALECL